MLTQPLQLNFQVVPGTDSIYLILKTFIFLKATCSTISSNGEQNTLMDSTAITMRLTI